MYMYAFFLSLSLSFLTHIHIQYNGRVHTLYICVHFVVSAHSSLSTLISTKHMYKLFYANSSLFRTIVSFILFYIICLLYSLSHSLHPSFPPLPLSLPSPSPSVLPLSLTFSLEQSQLLKQLVNLNESNI